MATTAQSEANRRNALLSTGPKTIDGKKASSKNAIRHGLLSENIVLLDEDREEFDRFRDDLASQLAPEGQLEALLAERVIVCAWRLRRVYRFESDVFAYHEADEKADLAREEAEAHEVIIGAKQARMVRNPEAHAPLMRKAEEAEQRRNSAVLGAIVVRDSRGPNTLANLGRYEGRIDRSLYRALHELQRLQAARCGEDVPPPAVLDVQVS